MSSDYGKLILPTETNIAAAAKRYAAISSSKRTLKKKNGRNPGQNNPASDHTLMKKLRDVLKLNPFHWNANFDIASVLSALEKPQFNRSLYHIHLCLDQTPLSWRCYHLKCLVYISMGSIDKALRTCKIGLSMHPGCGALHEQQRTLHTLIEHRAMRTEEGQHGEGSLAEYENILSERMKLALLSVLNKVRHSSIDPRDPDSLGNIAQDLLNVHVKSSDDASNEPIEAFFPPVVNLIKHYGPRRYECQSYYESVVYEREILDIIKIGKRGIKAIQSKHLMERSTKIKAWNDAKKQQQELEELKRERLAREERQRQEKLRILQLTDERIDNSSESKEKDVDHSQKASKEDVGMGESKEKGSATLNDLESNAQGNTTQKALRRNKAKKKKKKKKRGGLGSTDRRTTTSPQQGTTDTLHSVEIDNSDEKDAQDDSSSAPKLEETCPEFPLPKYVLFMDVDDTIFSTYTRMKESNMKTIPIFELSYLLDTQPEVIKPMLDFYDWIISKGNINIIFLSERPFYAHAKLEIALHNSGFNHYYSLICRDKMHQPSTCSVKAFKTRARKKILNSLNQKYGDKYRIFVIGEVGDQSCDFMGDDEQTEGVQIKIPNYMYTTE